MEICRTGNGDFVSLLDRGADIDCRDRYGNTPLMIALVNGRTNIAHQLIARSADVHAKSKDGYTPLTLVEYQLDDEDVMKAMLDQCLEKISKDGFRQETYINGATLLMIAAKNRHYDLVKAILNHDVNVNMQSESGETALIWATIGGCPLTVKALLDSGAEPIYSKDGKNFNALTKAASFSNMEAVVVLIENGVDINSTDDYGTTALFVAVANKNATMTSYLLEHGANPNITLDDGRSPLMQAAATSTDLVCLLLSYHADTSLKRENGRTAYDEAMLYGKSENALLIESHEEQMALNEHISVPERCEAGIQF